jgi:hypothetical protein
MNTVQHTGGLIVEPNNFYQLLFFSLTIIFSYLIGRYYHKKSETHLKRFAMSERSRIKSEYTDQLSEKLVKSIINKEEFKIDLKRIKTSINGKLLRQNHDNKEIDDKEIAEIIRATISLIDEQKYITQDIKEKGIAILFDMLNSVIEDKTSKHWDRDAIKIKQALKLSDEGYTYLVSILSAVIILLHLSAYTILKLDSALLQISSWISVIILNFVIQLSFLGFHLPDNLTNYLKSHSVVSIIVLFIAFIGVTLLLGSEFSYIDPLIEQLFIVLKLITWTLPFTTTAVFLYFKLRGYGKYNAQSIT